VFLHECVYATGAFLSMYVCACVCVIVDVSGSVKARALLAFVCGLVCKSHQEFAWILFVMLIVYTGLEGRSVS
jgi:hypothetical protein